MRGTAWEVFVSPLSIHSDHIWLERHKLLTDQLCIRATCDVPDTLREMPGEL